MSKRTPPTKRSLAGASRARNPPAASAGAARTERKATASHPAEDLLEEVSHHLDALCAILRDSTGHDFSRYKKGTLRRRVLRRLQVRKAASVPDYLRLVKEEPTEADALFQDLLVGVTQFFRDPEVFASIGRQALPSLLSAKVDQALRIWVPACATGEEAYSIAILVLERLAATGATRAVQIFATDIDTQALAVARRGRYPASIADDVSSERLERFFVHRGTAFEVAPALREICLFSAHNLIKDPPFVSLDLISCRNALIYLEADLQMRLVPLLHHALRPGGFLVLGQSEGLLEHTELFATVDKERRLFRRRETAVRPTIDFPLSRPLASAVAGPASERAAALRTHKDAARAFERAVLDDYAPACLAVTEKGNIAFLAGRTNRFLQPRAGAPSNNLLELTRGALRRELRAALAAAARAGGSIVRERVPIDGQEHLARVSVQPLAGTEPDQGLFLVAIQETALAKSEATAEVPGPPEALAVEQLESELRSTREDLHSVVGELESANEELESQNEELVSTNEELRASQEELQSVNEELATVNAELERKAHERAVALSDLQNLFASTGVATVFLDRELRLARFTPAATALFHFREADIGRPLADLAPRFAGADLLADARETMRTLARIERQVQAGDDAWFIERVLPYRDLDHAVCGAVITFLDVSELKRAEESLLRTTERAACLAEVIESGNTPFGSVAPDGSLAFLNRALCDLTGYSREELERASVTWGTTLTPPEWREPEAAVLSHARQTRQPARYEKECLRKDGSRVPVELSVQPVFDGEGAFVHFHCFATDISERKAAERRLAYLASFPERNPNPIIEADEGGSVRYANPTALRLFPDVREKGAAHPWLCDWEPVARAIREGDAATFSRTVAVSERTYHQALHFRAERGVVRIYGIDITERVQAEQERERLIVREREAAAAAERNRGQFEAIFQAVQDGIAVSDMSGNFFLVNQAEARINGFASAEEMTRALPSFAEVFELFLPDGQPLPAEQWPAARVLRGETLSDLELRGRRRDSGREWYFSFSGAPVRDESGAQILGAVVTRDVTEHKRAEHERALTVEFLSLVNRSRGLEDLVRDATTYFQRHSGCDAVGIRLREGDDYPYFESRGFPEEFVRTEASLCARDEGGQPRLDVEGNPVLECMCGNVICGRFNPEKPFFTARGSFWSNGTTQLLASTTDADRQARTRNRCNGEGYESVVLIALRLGEERLGLLQINDHRKRRFSPESIALWERLADSLSIAVAKCRVERALRESEGRLHQALEAANAGTWEWDLRTNANVWSDELWTLYGLESNNRRPSYEAWCETLHPEDRARAEQAVQEAAREGTAMSCEWRVRHPDGSEHWLMTRGRSVRDAEGRAARMVGIVVDVSERKRAETALLQSEEHYRSLFETMLQGVVYQDAQGQIVSMNPAAERILGRAREELLGRAAQGLEAPALREDGTPFPGAEHPAMLALRSGREIRDVVVGVFNPREKGFRWINLTAVPLFRDGASEPHQVYTLFADVTERRRAEEALRISEERYRAATEELRDADARKNEFLAMLSHELRNPLTPIRNSLYILDRTAPGGDQARRAQRVIDRQVGHMTRLVDDLLDVTRITRGKVQLRREMLDLTDLVRRTIEDHRTVFAASEVELCVNLAAEPLRVHGDATRLAQALGNLLGNAAKFAGQAGRAEVSVFRDERACQAVVRVSDSGVGIARDMLPRVFQPFAQADKTLDRSKGGLGLGLALVKGMVELHGGSVKVESEGPGTGAQFTVRLPLCVEERETRSAQEPGAAPQTPRRVLIIEDNVDAAESLRELLELSGHEIAVAYSGPEGLERARGFKPEVVLCDIGLPGMDGYEVARRLRADEALRETLLVALSGYALPEDVERARQAGFERHLAKPPSLAKLAQLMRGDRPKP
jgi:PAS domain S-box-containing protein